MSQLVEEGEGASGISAIVGSHQGGPEAFASPGGTQAGLGTISGGRYTTAEDDHREDLTNNNQTAASSPAPGPGGQSPSSVPPVYTLLIILTVGPPQDIKVGVKFVGLKFMGSCYEAVLMQCPDPFKLIPSVRHYKLYDSTLLDVPYFICVIPILDFSGDHRRY